MHGIQTCVFIKYSRYLSLCFERVFNACLEVFLCINVSLNFQHKIFDICAFDLFWTIMSKHNRWAKGPGLMSYWWIVINILRSKLHLYNNMKSLLIFFQYYFSSCYNQISPACKILGYITGLGPLSTRYLFMELHFT